MDSSASLSTNPPAAPSTQLSGSRFVMVLGVTTVLFFLGLIPFEALPEIPVDIDSKPFFIPLVLTALLPAGRPGLAVALGVSLGEGLRDMMEGYELDDPIGFIGYAVAFYLTSYVMDLRPRNPFVLMLGAIFCGFVQAAFEASSFLLFGEEGIGIAVQSALGNTVTHGVIWGGIPLIFLVPVLHGRFERYLGFAPKGIAQDIPPLQGVAGITHAHTLTDSQVIASVRGLQFRYPAQEEPALCGLDMDLPGAAVTGLIGPSDGGKSTLCRVVARLAPLATGGEIAGSLVLGNERVSQPVIGYVADNTAAMITQTRAILEVSAALAAHDCPLEDLERKALGVLASVDISEPEARQYIWELSDQKQALVALVAATAIEPDILILDEVASNLDRLGLELLRQQIAQVVAQGGSVLLADNAVDRQLEIADTIAIMAKGRIVASGPSASLLSDGEILARYGLRLPSRFARADEPMPIEQKPRHSAVRSDGKAAFDLRDVRMLDDDGDVLFNGLNLSVKSGTILGIAGASGSGKSALARLVAGLAPMEAGTVRVAGDDISDWSVAERLDHVATVIHSPYAFFSERTVWREMELSLGRSDLDDSERAERIMAMLQLMQVADARDDDPLTLPLGMAKRVQIAAMLARDAHLLIMDRPFANLDPDGVSLLGKAVRDYANQGNAVVLLDHDMDNLLFLTSDLVFLANGMVHRAKSDAQALLLQMDSYGLARPYATRPADQRMDAVNVESGTAP